MIAVKATVATAMFERQLKRDYFNTPSNREFYLFDFIKL